MSTHTGLLKRAGERSKGSGETGDLFCSLDFREKQHEA